MISRRGGIDLILSSPINSRTIFAVRAVTLVSITFLTNLISVGGIAVTLSILGGVRWLGIIPTLLGLSLLSNSLGLLLTFAMIRLFGAARTRVIAQIVSGMINALFFIIYQSANFLLNSDYRQHLEQYVTEIVNPLAAFEIGMWMLLPVRAAIGSIPDVLLLLVISGTVTVAVICVAHDWYLFGVQQAFIISQRSPRARKIRFRSGLWSTLILKDLRLLARDSVFITKTAMHLLYTVPAIFVLARVGNHQGAALQHALPISTGLIAGNLMHRISRQIIWAETNISALELSPINLRTIRPAKLLTALILTLALTTPMLLVGLWIPGVQIGSALYVLIGSSLSFGITNVWLLCRTGDTVPSQASSTDLELIGNLLVGVLLFAWTGVSVWPASGVWIGWVGLGVAVLIPTVIVMLVELANQRVNRMP